MAGVGDSNLLTSADVRQIREAGDLGEIRKARDGGDVSEAGKSADIGDSRAGDLTFGHGGCGDGGRGTGQSEERALEHLGEG
jgi:hypothetical protein